MSASYSRLAKRRKVAAARPSVDLRRRIASEIVDQGPRPTCVACAVAAAHEAERPGFSAAIEPVWWQLCAWGLADEFGTTLAAAARALPHCGHCEGHLWPYDGGLGFGTEPPPVAAGSPPWTCADLVPVALANDGIEDAIEDELAQGHPVLLVLEAVQEFLNPAADGYINVPPVTAPHAGYHAVLIVGAWTDPAHGRVLLVRNSWGEYWGAGGYGLLPVEYLINLGGQAAKVTT